jgi:hypothetical protein
MYFGMKNYLKNTSNHTVKHAPREEDGPLPFFSCKNIESNNLINIIFIKYCYFNIYDYLVMFKHNNI